MTPVPVPAPAPGMNTATLPASTAEAITGLQPAAVWKLFAEMNTVPRPSKHEEKIVAHMAAVADRLGLAHHEDALGNMVIEVPATPGHENVPITILQGHVDMVCEANAGTAIDFMNDPIELIRTKDTATGEDIIVANNTTLGADNGIGVCMALAAATDISSQPLYIRRPPLVLVHGILGSPDESWDDTLWSHNTPTRVYKADWEKDDDGNYTHHKGFIENFGYVARTIEQALRDYRRGSDSKAFTTAHAGVGNNHDFNQMRYAATRADVVAHSQGGLVTRWYIADMELHNLHTNTIERFHPPNNWGSIEVSDRDVYHEGTLWNHISQEWYSRGRWDYLRNDNYHAGAIRRFISIGSPYRGSHLADVAETATKPTTAIETAMRNWVYAHDGAMPASLQAFLFPDGPEGDYSAPTCVVDLMTESWATLFTRQATTYLTSDHAQGYVTTSYPTGPASVYWFGVSSSWSGTTPDDVQVLDVLSQLFAIVGDGNPTSSIIYYSTPTHTWHIRMSAVWQAIGVTNTDGVVPLASQRDADSLSQIKPNIRHYYRHTHYNLPYLPCDYVQKESQWIRNDVIELLYNNDYNGIDLPLIVDDDEIITLLHENKHYIPLVPSQ
jgi:triacylglycerol esterase/lipase EstA (alpha/beta hydrolase family)